MRKFIKKKKKKFKYPVNKNFSIFYYLYNKLVIFIIISYWGEGIGGSIERRNLLKIDFDPLRRKKKKD